MVQRAMVEALLDGETSTLPRHGERRTIHRTTPDPVGRVDQVEVVRPGDLDEVDRLVPLQRGGGCRPACIQPGTGSSGRTAAHSASVMSVG
jgi:hypothetical protein